MAAKITNAFYIACRAHFILLTALFHVCAVSAQDTLHVVDNQQDYQKIIKLDSAKMLVLLKEKIPGLLIDLRYAGRNNFTGQKLYGKQKDAWLRLPVASALQNVQTELNQKGYALKVFDAYRPYRVTVKMWDMIGDERYVANPKKGSGHNRGLSVDLTLVKTSDQTELDMGTGYDNFTDSAHHEFLMLSAAVLANRRLLKETMEKHGFRALSTEWWHYSWPNDRNFEVLDLTFKQLIKTK